MEFTFRTEPAIFLRRPNRFRVVVRRLADGCETDAHCPDPGRLRELLLPGARVHVSRALSTRRRTSYDLRFVEDPLSGRLISLDTRLPNRIFEEAVSAHDLGTFTEYTGIEREVSLPHTSANGIRSRIDFRLSNRDGDVCWVEVKSATLVVGTEARFPDAPTERGRRHVAELIELAAQGERAAVVFIVQRIDAARLAPNWKTDPAFGDILERAQRSGVELLAYTCSLDLHAIMLAQEIPVAVNRRSDE